MTAASPVALPIEAAEAGALFSHLSERDGLLVAVSGGPDSVALLILMAEWAVAGEQPRLAVATVDHGFRPEGRQEALDVAALCARLGLPHTILDWQGEHPLTSLQEAARKMRYRLLSDHARHCGCRTLVTAHTLDDQGETLLMRMAHGSGLTGLAGMDASTPIHGVTLERPLLGIAKARLVATLQARGIAYAADPSNADRRFERARWRGLAPQLAGMGLTAERMGTLARRLARADAALEARVSDLWPAVLLVDTLDECRLDFAALAGHPEEIGLRLLGRAVEHCGRRDDTILRLERLEACFAAFVSANAEGSALTRTLSGCLLKLTRDGVLVVTSERPRRRGVHLRAS